LFTTVKYWPDYSRKPCSSIDQACHWVATFVEWHNHQHRHIGIKLVTPSNVTAVSPWISVVLVISSSNSTPAPSKAVVTINQVLASSGGGLDE
jgi:hypothetical protein